MSQLHLKVVDMVSACKVSDNNRYVTKTCVEWDYNSMNMMASYCEKRFLFDLEALNKSVNVNLINITTGLLAPEEVNILDCKQIGEDIIAGMANFSPTSYKFSRSLTATQIPEKNSLKSAEKETVRIHINSDLLYQRLSSLATEKEKRDAFSYELSSSPAALFTDDGRMRESKKNKLAFLSFDLAGPAAIVKKTDIEESALVIDGGKLIHLVSYAWKKGSKFNSIINAYLSHIKQTLQTNNQTACTVVFDGYLNASTKDHTHQARYPTRSLEIQVTSDTVFDSKKDLFLSNPLNKQKFINLLSAELKNHGISCINCEEDADTEVVKAAIMMSRQRKVTVWADDADITVLLIHKIFEEQDGTLNTIYQDRVGKIYNLFHVNQRIPQSLQKSLLLVHAFSGCDTTSSIFGHGYKAITKEKLPRNYDQYVYYSSTAEKADIRKAGESIMLSLYNSQCKSLDEQRYLSYSRKIGSGGVNKKTGINPASLPPTSNACGYHSLRVYHQVQSWHGQTKNPLEYG